MPTSNNLLQELQEYRLKIRKIWLMRKSKHYYCCDVDWLRGFIEAEGSFTQNNKTNAPLFQITQLACEKPLMEAIKRRIGAGRLHLDTRSDGRQTWVYTLTNKKHINNKLLVICNKGFVFSRTMQRYNLWLQKHFPEKEMGLLFAANNPGAYNLQWLHGFTEGDGSFHFVLRKQSDYRWGYQVQAVFDLSQKVSSQEWLCVARHILGKETRYTLSHTGNTNHLRVVRRDLCQGVVCAMFECDLFQSRKRIDFVLWQWGLKLMAEKKHLQKQGWSLFRRIIALQKYYRAN